MQKALLRGKGVGKKPGESRETESTGGQSGSSHQGDVQASRSPLVRVHNCEDHGVSQKALEL